MTKTLDDGYDETSPELRMPFKILKDAGVVPREVEMFREIAALKRALHETASADEARTLRQRISELQQAIGRWFSNVDFIPARPKDFVEGKE